jgi:2,4-dichlorophenol 6-monooxygenase
MNTGIQDAHNLAWKLRLVLDGAAGARLLDTYERERRPVAQENADQSMQNAFRLLEVFEALGVGTDLGADRAAARARMADTLADAAGRDRVRAAIDGQRGHFDTFGLQLGFTYEDGALVPDGSEPPAVPDRARDYVPTTRPGARLPHAWVTRAGARVSTLDLVPEDGFTLITGPAASCWTAAAERLRLRTVVPGRDFADPEGRWAARAGIGQDGAILVRPDHHVAWRAHGAAPGGDAALAWALARVLDRA